MNKFDCIVIGGGHAGIEAAVATSKRNLKTAMITINKFSIAHMPCNPSIGGSAKGIVVRDISSLGGVMPIFSDNSLLQIKMLNKSKGPAVWSLRAQIDTDLYAKISNKYLNNIEKLTILEGEVEKLLIDKNNEIKGLYLKNNIFISAKYIIVTTGTYLNSNIHIGNIKKNSGPNKFKNNITLSSQFKNFGLKIKRLKTGTSARIKRSSINFNKMLEEKGDIDNISFSISNNRIRYNNESCYLTYVEEKTIDIILKNLNKSSFYSGKIEGIGPRYCPSIEDKIVRFSDKKKHQIFIEPISSTKEEMYIQGLSTSMPGDIQEKIIHSINGMENAVIINYGYAIEYDVIDSQQLYTSLESKIIKNLFFAGQINGTSGYEEAAAQGLIAGINVANKYDNIKPLILSRSDSYIGVMIDDLVTKGIMDPYRLLTSRAEYRLLLRTDNSFYRLSEVAFENKMISKLEYNKFLDSNKKINNTINKLKNINITPKTQINKYLRERKLNILYDKKNLFNFLKKNQINKNEFMELLNIYLNIENIKNLDIKNLSNEEWKQILILSKYEGYIKKNIRQINKLKKIENKIIPSNINYEDVPNLSNESIEKLKNIRPINISQALRISGVNIIDIIMLNLYIEKRKK